MKYLTKEQQVVVEYRLSVGYESQLLPNGDWLLWKGQHTVQINCLGYDCYVKKGMLS